MKNELRNKAVSVGTENLPLPHAPGQGPPVPKVLPGWPGLVKEALSWNWPFTPFPREAVAGKIRESKLPESAKNFLFKLEKFERDIGVGLFSKEIGM